MAKHLLISLMSLSSLFHASASSSSSSSSSSTGYLKLDLTRQYISKQAQLDAIMGIPGYHNTVARSQYQSHRAFRSMSSSSNPISGCPGQDFQTNVVVGGQTFSLTVDTGSSTLAVVSNECGSTCPTPVYTPGSTAQQQTNAPQAQSQYGDGSTWTGRVFQDQVSIGGSASVPVLFATIDQQSGFFQNNNSPCGTTAQYQSEGIIGFAYPSLAVSTTNTFFSQLVSNAGINNYFAMLECLNTGTLYLGGVDTSVYSGLIYYAPIIEQQWYVVQVTNMLLGGQQLSGVSASSFATDGSQGPTNAIVDSGTTDLVLPTTVYNTLVSALHANAAFTQAFGSTFLSQGCGYARDSTAFSSLPQLSIVFAAGFTLNLNGIGGYVYPTDTSSNPEYCSVISDGGASQTIMGWPITNQFVVIYDVGNTQVGFAQQTGCNNNFGGTITAGSATGQGPPSGSSGGSGSGSTTTKPTAKPATAAPTAKPATAAPTAKPATVAPTAKPATAAPTAKPATAAPTSAPTSPPTGHATSSPTSSPTSGHSTTAPATSAPTAGHSTSAPATSAPTSKTCPSGRMGSSCQYYYDELQCQVDVAYSQIGQSFGGLSSFSQEFAREIAVGANIPVSSIVVVSITDDGDYASVTITFDMLNTTSRLLQNAENTLGAYLNSASQDTQQSQTALASKVTSGGVTNLNNAGSMYDGSSSSDSSSSSMSLGLVAAIAGGAAALIVILIVASICMYRRRQSSTVALTSVHIAKATEDLPQLEQNYQVSPLQMAQLNNQYQQPTPLYDQQATAWQQQH